MARAPGYLLWMATVLLIYAGIHGYFWLRLIRGPALPAPLPALLTTLLIALALSLPSAMLLWRFTGLPVGDALLWPAFAWAGVAVYLLLALLGFEVARLLLQGGLWLAGSDALRDPAQRLLVTRALAAGAAVIGLGLAGWGIAQAATGPRLERVSIQIRNLPDAFDGLRIALISDLHAGRTIGRRYVEDVTQRVQALEPDLIAVTGDLVDGTPPGLGEVVEPITRLRARHGIFFVPGNHDHYSGVEPWIRWLKDRGVRVLRNERTEIAAGDARLDLAGVDDAYFNADLTQALAGRDPTRPMVLLSHQPQTVAAAAAHGVDLQLSGHTHGGQLWPGTWVARFMFGFTAGRYRVQETELYVSRGTGYVGPPMRLGAPSEITLISLQRSGDP